MMMDAMDVIGRIARSTGVRPLVVAVGLLVPVPISGGADPDVLTTCEPFATVPVADGRFIVQQNEWNSTLTQCIRVEGTAWRIASASFDLPDRRSACELPVDPSRAATGGPAPRAARCRSGSRSSVGRPRRGGGWAEWCITEDAELSLRMLMRGWSGLYIQRSYGNGIMPLTFSALKSQRFRWCFGGIQILRRYARSLMPWSGGRDNRLSVPQRLDYLFGLMHWFNDLIYLGFTATLLVTAAILFTTGRVGIRPILGALVLLPTALIASGSCERSGSSEPGRGSGSAARSSRSPTGCRSRGPSRSRACRRCSGPTRCSCGRRRATRTAGS